MHIFTSNRWTNVSLQMLVAMVAIVSIEWLSFLRCIRSIALEETTLKGEKPLAFRVIGRVEGQLTLYNK